MVVIELLKWVVLLVALLVVMHVQLLECCMDLVWGEYVPPLKRRYGA